VALIWVEKKRGGRAGSDVSPGDYSVQTMVGSRLGFRIS
jgi:hypothetical protein